MGFRFACDLLDISEGTMKNRSYTEDDENWQFINCPRTNQRLLRYETLREKYKQRVLEKYGDPYKLVEDQWKAEMRDRQLYFQEQLHEKWEDGISNEEYFDIVKNYHDQRASATMEILALAIACSVIRWYDSVSAFHSKEYGFKGKRDLMDWIRKHDYIKMNKFLGGLGMEQFSRKFAKYRKHGWKGLVSKKNGNRNSKKIATEEQMQAIEKFYNQHTCPTYVDVAKWYNELAIDKGWKTVTPQTICNYIEKTAGVLMRASTNRMSERDWRGKFMPSVSRDRPSEAGLLLVADATAAELYFKEGDKTWNRLYMCLIIDAYNDTILGWSFDDTENSDMIIQAWRMAIINTELLPAEVKMDRFALKKLTPFYESMSKYVRPSRAGNAKDKVIEPFFKRFNEAHFKHCFNWSGSNVGAKKDNSQPNQDFTKLGKKFYPDRETCMYQILESIQQWNEEGGRYEKWRQSVARNPKARELDRQSMIDIFGQWLPHEDYKYTHLGIMLTINGEKHQYRVWDDEEQYMQLIGLKGHKVKILPEDLGLAKIENAEGKEFWLKKDQKEKMAFADQTEGDRTRLNLKLRFQNSLIKRVKAQNKALQESLEEKGMLINPLRTEAEALTKGFFVVDGRNKELMHNSENILKTLQISPAEADAEEDYYDSVELDLSQFSNLDEAEESDV